MLSDVDRRFLELCVGKACALAVLFISLSNQMSLVVEFDYFDGGSFGICLAVAIALAASLRLLERPKVRLALSTVCAVLALGWVALLVALQASLAFRDSTLPVLLVSYAAVGRVVTLLLNMLWNYQFVLNGPEETPRHVVGTVLLSFVFFFSCIVAGGVYSRLLMVTMLLSSSFLNVWRSFAETRGLTGHWTANSVADLDAARPVAAESQTSTRLLYFSSRCMYGLTLGLLVSLSAGFAPVTPGVGPCLAMAGVAILPLGLVVGRMLTRKGSLLLVVTLPILACLLVYIALDLGHTGSWACAFALLAEVAWTTQNLFQLPTYRQISGLHPASFSFADYACQIIPYYLIVWLLSSSGLLESLLRLQGLSAESLAALFLVALLAFCVFAMVRHTISYVPAIPIPDGEEGSGVTRIQKGAELVGGERDLEALTEREGEVFALMAAGYSRTYIGKVLFISPDTVKTHAKHIYAKLGINSKDELIAYSKQLGGVGAVGSGPIGQHGEP